MHNLMHINILKYKYVGNKIICKDSHSELYFAPLLPKNNHCRLGSLKVHTDQTRLHNATRLFVFRSKQNRQRKEILPDMQTK